MRKIVFHIAKRFDGPYSNSTDLNQSITSTLDPRSDLEPSFGGRLFHDLENARRTLFSSDGLYFPQTKSSLMKACAASVWYDQKASVLEVELLRAFASALDCPVPAAVA